MAEKGLSAYLCSILRNSKAEVWRVIRVYVIVQVVWLFASIAGLLVAPLFFPNATQLPSIGTSVFVGSAGIIFFALCALAYAFLNLMSRTHWEQKSQISRLELVLAEKQQAIDAVREPVFDMSGEAVVDYMFRNTEYQTTDEIGIALSIAASRKQIDVAAARIDDWRPLPVDSTMFQENTFWLLSQNTNDEGKAFNAQRQYDESGHYTAYPPGGCIWGINDHKILYESPIFCRAQIEARWPRKNIT